MVGLQNCRIFLVCLILKSGLLKMSHIQDTLCQLEIFCRVKEIPCNLSPIQQYVEGENVIFLVL